MKNIKKTAGKLFAMILTVSVAVSCVVSTGIFTASAYTAPKKGKITVAEAMGKIFAEALKKKGVTKISFDRGGYLYHGRVKALAESIRKNGIQF